MQTHADKDHENQRSRSSAANTRKKEKQNTAPYRFEDHRPEAIQMQKWQEMADNYSDKNPLQFEDHLPQVARIKRLQELANSSPRNQRLAQLQNIINGHMAEQELPIQKKPDPTGLPHNLQTRAESLPEYSIEDIKKIIETPAVNGPRVPIQKKEAAASPPPSANNTGMSDTLKTGLEHLSGMSLDEIKVYYNSKKPAQFQAHAYAQGTDIHLGPGKEKHLPHEAWHVVQQKQGKVKPTLKLQGVNINDDAVLEREADVMGKKAMQTSTLQKKPIEGTTNCYTCTSDPVMQYFTYTNQRGISTNYDNERTVQRPDLKGVVESYGTVIAELYNILQNINEHEAGRMSLADVKNHINIVWVHDKLNLKSLAEMKDWTTKEHARLLEKARLQEIVVDDKGELDNAALDARLVEYDETSIDQEKTKVSIAGGTLRRSATHDTAPNLPVDTANSVTQHTGKGWEIFVMSPTGELHMASHKIGKYHHSSLLGGGAVAGAGTIKASNGTITHLNDKSGHYRPKAIQTKQVLHMLERKGVNLSGIDLNSGFGAAAFSGPANTFLLTADKSSIDDANRKEEIKASPSINLLVNRKIQMEGIQSISEIVSVLNDLGLDLRYSTDGYQVLMGDVLVPDAHIMDILKKRLSKTKKKRFNPTLNQDTYF
ncbi:MAG: DUF4157 domain-containing protein [Bacteroidota bacterium]